MALSLSPASPAAVSPTSPVALGWVGLDWVRCTVQSCSSSRGIGCCCSGSGRDALQSEIVRRRKNNGLSRGSIRCVSVSGLSKLGSSIRPGAPLEPIHPLIRLS
uniref:Uncharacterized protein n=1 Tax=Arundo donax TaxID=35708 RepID=A0A0A9G6C4_ARUDO